jgi:hypothetical protein
MDGGFKEKTMKLPRLLWESYIFLILVILPVSVRSAQDLSAMTKAQLDLIDVYEVTSQFMVDPKTGRKLNSDLFAVVSG